MGRAGASRLEMGCCPETLSMLLEVGTADSDKVFPMSLAVGDTESAIQPFCVVFSSFPHMENGDNTATNFLGLP